MWETDVARFGIDVWMTTTALAGEFRVCQSFLGAKIHDAKDPGADLAAMLVQVVSAVFDLMDTYAERWMAVEGAEAGPPLRLPLRGRARAGERQRGPHGGDLRPGRARPRRDLGRALEEDTLRGVAALSGAGEREFRFPDPLWVQVVHEFAVAYHRRALPREQLLRSLVPLYLGRTASFVLQNEEAGSEAVEGAILSLADEFVRQKPRLRERWTS